MAGRMFKIQYHQGNFTFTLARNWLLMGSFLLILIIVSLGYSRYFKYFKPISRANYKIINTHEHLQSRQELTRLLPAMKETSQAAIMLVASPIETILLNGKKTFTKYDENNQELLEIARLYPDKFYVFCTIDPRDQEKLNKLKNCLGQGAKGLKLYTGHGYYYDTFNTPLDDPQMEEIYQHMEQNQIPILWHVNLTKYKSEFDRVLKKYPKLKINIAHFGLWSSKVDQLRDLFETYPGLYIDVSFGYLPYTVDGLERVSKNVEAISQFILDYPERILWGSDEVITNVKSKDTDYLIKRFNCYRDMMEQETYTCPLVDEFWQKKNKQKEATPIILNGLNLKPANLKKIYEENPKRFLGI